MNFICQCILLSSIVIWILNSLALIVIQQAKSLRCSLLCIDTSLSIYMIFYTRNLVLLVGRSQGQILDLLNMWESSVDLTTDLSIYTPF